MMNEAVPNFYRCLRQKRKLSQTAFGHLIGKDRKTIARWETGETRPTYEDERRLFAAHGYEWHETLEALAKAVTETAGRPVSISFEVQEPEQPTHPLTLAERRLRERGARLPEKLRQQLQRRILDARARAARVERTQSEVLDHVDACIDAWDRASQGR